MTRPLLVTSLVLGCLLGPRAAGAHEGPPFPIVTNHTVAGLRISIWTDPDTTDDGSKRGQFWVMIDPEVGRSVPPSIAARVSIRPLDRPGEPQAGETVAVDEDPSRRFVALVMDHEGPFAVHVELDGAGSPITLDSEVQATYDLRPPRALLALYVLPFVLVGLLWTTLLVRRHRLRSVRPA